MAIQDIAPSPNAPRLAETAQRDTQRRSPRAACRCRRTGRSGRSSRRRSASWSASSRSGRSARARAASTASSGRSPAPSARTFVIFFTEGDAWTDISFTFRSTILGFIIGTTAGSLFGLSFWWSRNYAAIAQPYIICFESMPKLALAPLIILVFGLGLDLEGRDRHCADHRDLDADHLRRRQGARSGRREAVLFARRDALAGVPQAGRAVLPALDHLGAAGQHRPRADRRHCRRIHLVAAWPRPHHLLRRLDLRDRARLGRRVRALGARRSSCTRRCRGSRACCAKAHVSNSTGGSHGQTQIPRHHRGGGRGARRQALHRARRQARAPGRRAGAFDRLPADVHRDGEGLFRRSRHQREDRHHRDRRPATPTRCCPARPSPSSAGPSTAPSPRPRAPSFARSCIASTAATSISAPPRAWSRKAATSPPSSRARRSPPAGSAARRTRSPAIC